MSMMRRIFIIVASINHWNRRSSSSIITPRTRTPHPCPPLFFSSFLHLDETIWIIYLLPNHRWYMMWDPQQGDIIPEIEYDDGDTLLMRCGPWLC
jgi:hypothetical protein